jgi:hypothetical protein
MPAMSLENGLRRYGKSARYQFALWIGNPRDFIAPFAIATQHSYLRDARNSLSNVVIGLALMA